MNDHLLQLITPNSKSVYSHFGIPFFQINYDLKKILKIKTDPIKLIHSINVNTSVNHETDSPAYSNRKY